MRSVWRYKTRYGTLRISFLAAVQTITSLVSIQRFSRSEVIFWKAIKKEMWIRNVSIDPLKVTRLRSVANRCQLRWYCLWLYFSRRKNRKKNNNCGGHPQEENKKISPLGMSAMLYHTTVGKSHYFNLCQDIIQNLFPFRIDRQMRIIGFSFVYLMKKQLRV